MAGATRCKKDGAAAGLSVRNEDYVSNVCIRLPLVKPAMKLLVMPKSLCLSYSS